MVKHFSSLHQRLLYLKTQGFSDRYLRAFLPIPQEVEKRILEEEKSRRLRIEQVKDSSSDGGGEGGIRSTAFLFEGRKAKATLLRNVSENVPIKYYDYCLINVNWKSGW